MLRLAGDVLFFELIVDKLFGSVSAVTSLSESSDPVIDMLSSPFCTKLMNEKIHSLFHTSLKGNGTRYFSYSYLLHEDHP